MSDDKRQLTVSDYNAETADEYAAVAGYDTRQTPSYEVAETANTELPATSSWLSGGVSLDLSGTPDVGLIQLDRDPCPSCDECSRTATAFEAGMDDGTSSTANRETPRWILCTPQQWATIALCVLLKITILFVIIWFTTYNKY